MKIFDKSIEFLKKKFFTKKLPYDDLRNLDYTFARYILPRLILFKEEYSTIPLSIKSTDEWNEHLDKMIKAFKYIVEDYNIDKLEAKENILDKSISNKEFQKRYDEEQEGLQLFGKYFSSLWFI